ncbi:MAG: hydrogenase/sulfur reductase subunit alpha [Desulfuromonas sp. SDB]|nr:MAG: hydrogenase/sulfur reductase subunit alpha [Desulfuromonas sp. SDB]
MKDININVHHLTRVEGHGNIVVNVKEGKIERCEWQVPEAPRFFEAMIRGRHYSEVQRITSRICGICSVGHTLASLKATENALGIKISKQSEILRRMLKHAENFDSHVLHVFFLVAPDLFGVKSVFPLVETNSDVVKIALRMKRLGHEWGSLLAGRTTHPIKCIPGGWSEYPDEEQLNQLKKLIADRVPDVETTVEVLASVAHKIPDFTRETEYIGLVDEEEYGMYDGKIGCLMPDGKLTTYEVQDYRSVTNEWVSPLSTAKYTKHSMDSYMVGALARININFDRLHPQAKKVAQALGFKAICFNPYMNSVAQFIEAVHSAYTTLDYADQLLEMGVDTGEKPAQPTKFGKGFGSTEVPRGILFHEYEYDKDGFCVGGNCIIPTNQNHANIQKDFEKILPEMLEKDKSEKEIELTMEMLVRAYDPCISCSAHYLDVEFKR